MEQKREPEEILEWLKGRPELLKRLEQMRELEGSDPDLDMAELELLELGKGMCGSSLRAILQQKSEAAEVEVRRQTGARKQGKKN